MTTLAIIAALSVAALIICGVVALLLSLRGNIEGEP